MQKLNKNLLLTAFASLAILTNSSNALAEQRPLLSQEEIKILKSIGCRHDNFHFENGRLIFGHNEDDQDGPDNNKKLLFLIKNIGPNDEVINFPEGQLGATAWISQYIKKDEWTAYLYIPGKDVLQTVNGIKQTKWTCNNASYQFGKSKPDCEDSLYICNVTNVTSKNTPLKSNIRYIIDNINKSWWANISSPENSNSANSIEDLFRIWRNGTADPT